MQPDPGAEFRENVWSGVGDVRLEDYFRNYGDVFGKQQTQILSDVFSAIIVKQREDSAVLKVLAKNAVSDIRTLQEEVSHLSSRQDDLESGLNKLQKSVLDKAETTDLSRQRRELEELMTQKVSFMASHERRLQELDQKAEYLDKLSKGTVDALRETKVNVEHLSSRFEESDSVNDSKFSTIRRLINGKLDKGDFQALTPTVTQLQKDIDTFRLKVDAMAASLVRVKLLEQKMGTVVGNAVANSFPAVEQEIQNVRVKMEKWQGKLETMENRFIIEAEKSYHKIRDLVREMEDRLDMEKKENDRQFRGLVKKHHFSEEVNRLDKIETTVAQKGRELEVLRNTMMGTEGDVGGDVEDDVEEDVAVDGTNDGDPNGTKTKSKKSRKKKADVTRPLQLAVKRLGLGSGGGAAIGFIKEDVEALKLRHEVVIQQVDAVRQDLDVYRQRPPGLEKIQEEIRNICKALFQKVDRTEFHTEIARIKDVLFQLRLRKGGGGGGSGGGGGGASADRYIGQLLGGPSLGGGPGREAAVTTKCLMCGDTAAASPQRKGDAVIVQPRRPASADVTRENRSPTPPRGSAMRVVWDRKREDAAAEHSGDIKRTFGKDARFDKIEL